LTDRTELDRAILHVVNQQRQEGGLEPISELGYIGETRNFVRNILAELLRGMEPKDRGDFGYGYDTALAEIKRRAGLEGEG
jgi:hypothetical protein